MQKQKIEIEVENPEALKIAGDRLTKAIVDLWWNNNEDKKEGLEVKEEEKK